MAGEKNNSTWWIWAVVGLAVALMVTGAVLMARALPPAPAPPAPGGPGLQEPSGAPRVPPPAPGARRPRAPR